MSDVPAERTAPNGTPAFVWVRRAAGVRGTGVIDPAVFARLTGFAFANPDAKVYLTRAGAVFARLLADTGSGGLWGEI